MKLADTKLNWVSKQFIHQCTEIVGIFTHQEDWRFPLSVFRLKAISSFIVITERLNDDVTHVSLVWCDVHICKFDFSADGIAIQIDFTKSECCHCMKSENQWDSSSSDRFY